MNQQPREWKTKFTTRFANPTAKFLGNDFADYPKANIKDVVDFISSIEDIAYEKGLKESLECLPKEKKVTSRFASMHKMYNQALKESKLAIERRIYE